MSGKTEPSAGTTGPAQPFDEVGGALGDLFGKLDHVDAPQDDVIGLHGVGA